MSGTVHNFAESLAWGQRMEGHFLDVWRGRWPSLRLPVSPERRYDFNTSDGRSVELKTERRLWTDTEFLFLEKGTQGKAGGPWRALRDKVDVYVWWFPQPTPLILWWDSVPQLVGACEKWLRAKPRYSILIRNKGFSGHGYKVPREELEKSATRVFRL